jgi:hypothetical protein
LHCSLRLRSGSASTLQARWWKRWNAPAFDVQVEDMSETLASDNGDLMQRYCDLADAVRMIRRAAERAVRAGVLPPFEHQTSFTLLQECEAVARALYAAAGRQKPYAGSTTLAGLSRDDLSVPSGLRRGQRGAA